MHTGLFLVAQPLQYFPLWKHTQSWALTLLFYHNWRCGSEKREGILVSSVARYLPWVPMCPIFLYLVCRNGPKLDLRTTPQLVESRPALFLMRELFTWGREIVTFWRQSLNKLCTAVISLEWKEEGWVTNIGDRLAHRYWLLECEVTGKCGTGESSFRVPLVYSFCHPDGYCSTPVTSPFLGRWTEKGRIERWCNWVQKWHQGDARQLVRITYHRTGLVTYRWNSVVDSQVMHSAGKASKVGGSILELVSLVFCLVGSNSGHVFPFLQSSIFVYWISMM